MMEGAYFRGNTRSDEGFCIHWLNEHKKEVVLTLVALVAIGAVVVGLLAIFANTTSFSGAGSIGQIGLPGGATASAVGALVLFAIASYYVYKRSNCFKLSTADPEPTHRRRYYDSDDKREPKSSRPHPLKSTFMHKKHSSSNLNRNEDEFSAIEASDSDSNKKEARLSTSDKQKTQQPESVTAHRQEEETVPSWPVVENGVVTYYTGWI